jgi:hypothetical protein
MSPQPKQKAITLVELLIAMVLFTSMILAFNSIHTFSYYSVLSAERRTKLQNEAYYILAHMAKNINQTCGISTWPLQILYSTPARLSLGFYFWTDPDLDYTSNDPCYIYTYRDNQDTGNYLCKLEFKQSCAAGSPQPLDEVISNRVTSFVPTFNWNGIKENFVTVNVTLCWKPPRAAGDTNTCGQRDNPTVTLRERIYMPGVTTK